MKMAVLALAGLGVWAVTGRLHAQGQVDPNQAYQATPSDGPWMICVASYSGEPAASLAQALVRELRGERYRLQAFLYNRGADERRKQQEELNQQLRQRREYLQRLGADPDTPLRVRRVRVEDQYAVLVGGYKDMETARKSLEAIRKLPPPSKEFCDSIISAPAGPAGAPGVAAKQNQEAPKTIVLNPFLTAFVVRNPTVPIQHQDKADAFLKQLNAGESYSLLNCRKPWTLLIKEFSGPAVVQPSSAPDNLLNKLLGKNSSDALAASALQAHEVARVLRDNPQFRLEAYVLHTRYSSRVTVGGYDTPDDPKLRQNARLLANLQLGTVQMSATPVPMPVPR